MEPGECGEGVSGVEGAEEGFSARLDERGEGDGEFADPEPAGAAVDVGAERVVDCGLDGEIGGAGWGKHGVFAPSHDLCGLRIWVSFL